MGTTNSITSPAAVAATFGISSVFGSPRVYTRYRPSDHLELLGGPLGDSWLTRGERAELAAWRDERRRRAWLLGRWCAKQLIAEMVGDLRAERIEILSRDAAGRVNRPRVWCDGVAQSWSLSISHSHRGVLAALATDPALSVGVDLADCETFSDGFVDLWFTPGERNWFHETQSSSIACFIWAAKEALYKACNHGEGFAPRDVEVLADGKCSYRRLPLADSRLQFWTIDSHLAVLATVGVGRESNYFSR
jgi:phosphopantetheinyl transferase